MEEEEVVLSYGVALKFRLKCGAINTMRAAKRDRARGD